MAIDWQCKHFFFYFLWIFQDKFSGHGKRIMRNLGYGERNELIRWLRFRNYAEYLRSDLWKCIRTAGFKRHGRNCFLCNRLATTLHHLDYDKDTLLGRKLSNLVPLCKGCHRKVEFTPKGNKRTLLGAKIQYAKLRESFLTKYPLLR